MLIRLLAILMLAEKVWRHVTVVRFFRRPVPPPRREVRLVSILQPILSGDPTMPDCLERNLRMRTRYPLEFIWLVDDNDHEGERICRRLIARYRDRAIRLHLMPPPGERDNPKMVKLIEGARLSRA